VEWLLQRLRTELTPRDLYRPPDLPGAPDPEVNPVGGSIAGYALNQTE
jgi:hypothetical protein